MLQFLLARLSSGKNQNSSQTQLLLCCSVRPPKKSWKKIFNLSGGEKTLSSLALVFALHHYKPTPLYFMDEIDAALDFKNVSIVAFYIYVSSPWPHLPHMVPPPPPEGTEATQLEVDLRCGTQTSQKHQLCQNAQLMAPRIQGSLDLYFHVIPIYILINFFLPLKLLPSPCLIKANSLHSSSSGN